MGLVEALECMVDENWHRNALFKSEFEWEPEGTGVRIFKNNSPRLEFRGEESVADGGAGT